MDYSDNNILQLSSITNNVITNYHDNINSNSSDESPNNIKDCFKTDADFWNSFELFYYIHLALAICYGILCLLCVIHFFYKLYNSPSHNFHNWFYPLLFIGSAARGILMVYMFMPTPTYGFILTLFVFIPSFVFFSAYLIILLRWAQIYHNSYEMSSLKYEHLRIMFYVVNAVMYTAMTVLLTLQVVFDKRKDNPKENSMCKQSDDVIGDAISSLCSALYILTPLGFMLYTFRITRKFRFLPSRSPAKREVSRRLQRFTLLVVLVFFCRAVVIFCFDINIEINYSIKYPWSDGVYYFVLEIIPLVLMFLILRMHTSKNMDSHSSGPSATTPLINHTLAFV